MLGHWEVPLDGNAEDLLMLCDVSDFDQAEIAHLKGRFVLVFARQENNDPEEVMARSNLMAKTLSALARLHLNSYTSICTTGHLIPVSPSGGRGIIVFPGPGELSLKGMPLRVQTDGTPSPPPAQPVQSDFKIAMGDQAVEEALRLWDSGRDPLWGDMYKVFEVIKHDTGNKIPDSWASSNKIKLFRQTANTTGAGNESRHGVETKQPPASPMPKPVAKELMTRLLKLWIASKHSE